MKFLVMKPRLTKLPCGDNEAEGTEHDEEHVICRQTRQNTRNIELRFRYTERWVRSVQCH
jgi:hypothetical protein